MNCICTKIDQSQHLTREKFQNFALQVTFGGFQRLADGCPNLTSLVLDDLPVVDDAILKVLMPHTLSAGTACRAQRDSASACIQIFE